MKKITSAFSLFISLFAFSQENYTKIKPSHVNQERMVISKDFTTEFLQRCESNNFAGFNRFKVSKKLEARLKNDASKICVMFPDKYGNIKLIGLNSVYFNTKTKNYDPLDLYIFDIVSEKNRDVKFISVWIYHDQNIIDGIWLSTAKPWEKSAMIRKESAL